MLTLSPTDRLRAAALEAAALEAAAIYADRTARTWPPALGFKYLATAREAVLIDGVRIGHLVTRYGHFHIGYVDPAPGGHGRFASRLAPSDARDLRDAAYKERRDAVVALLEDFAHNGPSTSEAPSK